VLQQGLESIQVIQAFGRQELQQKELGDVSQATVAAALRARRIKSLLSPVVTVTVAACTAVVLWRGAWLIVHDMMTVGELTVFLAYLSKFFKPVKDLATMTNQIAQAAVGVERIRVILDTDTIIEEKPDAVEPGPLVGAIEFQNVAFGYDQEVPVLRDVTFKIDARQFIGVVGPTGAGKSTIFSLIPRFYAPFSGVVRIDGKDVCDLKLKDLRDQISTFCRTPSSFAVQ
jgi:ABC-type multidrug transport system fused ATPase/permease subunit